MDESTRIESLLNEIRDLQKEHLAAYKEHAAHALQLSEESVKRQKDMAALYRKVLVVVAILFVILLGFLWW